MAEITGSNFEVGRRNYFVSLALKHVPEMRLIGREGKLYRSERWHKTIEHSIVVTAVASVLAKWTGLSGEDTTKLTKAAITHDWDKRLENNQEDFTSEEKHHALEYLSEVNPDKHLLASTKNDYVVAYFQGKVKPSLLNKIIYYADAIVSWSRIVPYDDRVDEAAIRNPDYANRELDQKVGGPFILKEKEMGHGFERDIFESFPSELKEKIKRPSNIPTFVKKEIEAAYRQTSS